MRHGTVQVRRPEDGADTMVWPPEMLRRPEIRGIDRVALHLEVQGLVIHPEESSRLTLVATRGVKSQAYRLPLRLGGGAVGALLQCEARVLSSPATRSRVLPRGHGSHTRNSQTNRCATSQSRHLWLKNVGGADKRVAGTATVPW